MRRTAACLASLTAVACCALAGCYQKVVGVKGPASQRYTIEEPSIGPNESVWSTDGRSVPRPIEEDRYSDTTLDQSKPMPAKRQVPSTEP